MNNTDSTETLTIADLELGDLLVKGSSKLVWTVNQKAQSNGWVTLTRQTHGKPVTARTFRTSTFVGYRRAV